MRKIFKFLLCTIMMLAVCTFSSVAINANTSITVSLEQQEDTTNHKIRYISTISNVTSLDDISTITFHLSATKDANTSEAERNIQKVYTEVAGANGKAAQDNTYYAVITISDILDFKGYTLDAYLEYDFSDSSSKNTNIVHYTIPNTISYNLTSTGSNYFEVTGSINDLFTADSIENGNIFHAWNWSMDTIKDNLDSIKAAGFTTIQTSPMQPQKDYYAGNAVEAWWKLYQPLGFVIAPDTCNNALGTKTDLIEMVEAAHAKGLKVIVDVVANHLGGSYNKFDSAVATYESTIYGSNGTLSGGALIHSSSSNGVSAQDGWHTTDGHIGLPDLDTGNSHVQQRVLSLLKEYIDCDVDGFRFDAAKHIETDNSSEPWGSSNFWPYVIGGATSYAAEKNKETPYYYGEILNGCGDNRSYSWYTKYMDVIDNTTGNNITSSFNSGTASSSSTYNTGCTADQVVIWGESHDTYANESHETTFINQSVIDKTYAYGAARGKAKSLYLDRPCADNQLGNINSENKLVITCPVLLGAKGTWDAYKSAQIAAVNKFHNYWGDASEWIASNSNFSEIVRYNDTESGMVLINAGSDTSVSNVEVPSVMKDGTYVDLVTNTNFTVSGGKVSGTMNSCGIAVLVSPNAVAGGNTTITSSEGNTFYSNTLTVTYTISNAASATITVNGECLGSITSGAELTFGSDMVVGETITVTITAKDSSNNSTIETFTYRKVEAPAVFKTYFEKPESWGTVSAKLINSTSSTTEAMTYDANTDTYYVEYVEGTSYTNVQFTDGTNTTEAVALGAGLTYKLDTDTSVVYFTNNHNWTSVYAHKWDGTETDTTWPGVLLSVDSTSGYYKTSITGYGKIIFNNGNGNGKQTVNISIDNSKGAVVYSIDSLSGKTYTVTKTYKLTTGSLCSHTYGSPLFTWNEFDSATATFTCTKCNASRVVDAVITSEVTTAPTETETGVRTYTATVTFEEVNYTDTKEETIPALSTVVTVPAVAPTCSTPGNILYYQKGTKYYSDLECQNEITLESTVLPATGNHTAAPGIYSTTESVVCSVCGEEISYTPDQTTVYYLVNSEWGDSWNVRANIHYWIENGEGTTWPGEQMTNNGTIEFNGTTYTVYSYTFTNKKLTDYDYVIFNSGSTGVKETNSLSTALGANCYLNNWDDNYSETQFIYIPA